MINTDIQPKAVLDLEADSLGNWQIDLPKNLPDGVHTILVTDEFGEQQDVAFVSVGTKEKTQFVDRVQEITPTWMIYAILFFLVVILTLAGNNLRLAWKKKRLSKKEDTQLKKYSVGLSFASILFSVFVGGILIFSLIMAKTNQLASQTKQTQNSGIEQNLDSVIDKISGAVINPRDMSLVKDVAISYRETEIKTSEGGNFVFTNVKTGDYIRLVNDDLPLPVYFYVNEAKMKYWDLYFDKDLYLLMMNIAEAERNSDIDYIYTNLADGIKGNVALIDYVQGYSKLYNSDVDSLVVDELVQVSDFAAADEVIYPKVYKFVVDFNGSKKQYYFVLENLNWKSLY